MESITACYRCKTVFDSSHDFVRHVSECRQRTIDKNDKGKPRWSLIPSGTLSQIIKVLEFGAAFYQVDNWQGVPDARRRYYDATMRHVEAWWKGELKDSETGLPHLAHAATCLLFLMWFDDWEKNDA